MPKIHLRQDEIVLCVLDYLKQAGLIQAMRALEHETGLTTTNYGTDLDFLRSLILDAQFDDAESFVLPLANVDDFDANRVLFEIRRQRFLELVDGNEGEAAQHVLSTSLKQLESKCSRAEWHKLCYCLTLQSLSDHPDYTNWTPYRGRMDCFESLRREFDRALSEQWSQQREKMNRLNPNHLVTLLQQSALYQASSYLAENSSRTLPNPMFFDLLSPTFMPMDANGKPAGPQGRDLASRSDILSTDVMRRAQLHMGLDGAGRSSSSSSSSRKGTRGGGSQYPMANVEVEGDQLGSLRNPRRVIASRADQHMRSSWAAGGGRGGPRQQEQMMRVSKAPPVPNSMASAPLQQQPDVIKKPVSWEVPLGSGEVPTVDQFTKDGETNEERVTENQENKEQAMSLVPTPTLETKLETSNERSENVREEVSEEHQDVVSRTTTSIRETSTDTNVDARLSGAATDHGRGSGREEDEKDSSIFQAKYRVFAECVESHAIRAVAVSPDGTRVAIGTNGRHLKVVATPSIERARSMLASMEEKNGVSGGQKGEGGGGGEGDGGGGEDGEMSLKPRVVTEFPKHHLGSVYEVAWSSDSKMLASCSNDMTVRVVPVRPADYHPTMGVREDECDVDPLPTVYRGHEGTVRSVCFVGGERVVSGGAGDCGLRVWDPNHQGTGDGPLLTLKGHTGAVFSVCSGAPANANGGVLNLNTVVSGGEDRTVRVWDLRSGSCVASIGADGVSHRDDGTPSMAKCPVQTLAVCPHSDATVVTGHEDGYCCVWDLKASRLLWMLQPHESQCRSVTYSPGGRYILSASFDGTIAVSDGDVWERRVVAKLNGHTGKVLRADWHPTDNIFVSSSTDCTVKLWGNMAGRR